jgi:hypothetical protein
MARGELAEVQSRLLHAARRKYFAADEQAAVSALADRAMKTTTALLKSKLPFLKRRGERRGKKPPAANQGKRGVHPAPGTQHRTWHQAPGTRHGAGLTSQRTAR